MNSKFFLDLKIRSSSQSYFTYVQISLALAFVQSNFNLAWIS